MTTKRYQWP